MTKLKVINIDSSRKNEPNKRLLSHHGIFPLPLNKARHPQACSEIAKKCAPLSKVILRLYEELAHS